LGCRKLIVGKYVVVYRIYDGQATVLRVFYGPSNYVDRIDV
jgi:mRNA-degrading endonuclease RelE of RelBE toxin-antitoxin system